MTPFNTWQGDRPVQVTVGFAKMSDIEELHALMQKPADASEPQLLAYYILNGLLAEIDEYEAHGRFADNEMHLGHLYQKGTSESGAALVFRVSGKIVSVTFFHVTWKGNVFLDWMTIMPKMMTPPHKIKELGDYMLATVLVVARQFFASKLVFIESKKGIAARFHKKVLKLKEECDFILLMRDHSDSKMGWKISEHIYGLAESSK